MLPRALGLRSGSRFAALAKLLPNTRGRTLEQLEHELTGRPLEATA